MGNGTPSDTNSLSVKHSDAKMMIGAATLNKRDYLQPSVEGKLHYAFGQTEPQAGSDPGGIMQTRAVLDGDDWVLNGTKTFISGAATADYILIQAVTDPEKRQRGGITMFIVDSPSPGGPMLAGTRRSGLV